ncbi:uncharacterized protein LOC116344164 [Contarinia nasturtii]|uniref:uncharacterized protein LOC116344164 n=1 Tax=Contarinia nasturtii TaxID=265458 RepID=UPI0012D387E2|nr:uncharacterized protein LOC116344164 [Contarinia nasturtii]
MVSKQMRILTWIFIFTTNFLIVYCDEILIKDYKELKCTYDPETGDQVCDCKNRKRNFILPLLEGTLKNVIVKNCKEVKVLQETFQNVDYIEHIQFDKIKELSLENYSLQFKQRLPIPKIKLIFNDVRFSEILPHSISGCIDSISFNNSHIEKLSAYAINSVCQTVYKLSIENTKIDWVDSQALKKLSIEHFIMQNTTFSHDLPSRTFSALIIKNVMSITNCTFAGISTRTIELDDGNDFIFSNNKVDRLDGEAFRMNANGRIIFERNNFSQISHSALSAINLGENAKHHQNEIQFLANEIKATDFPIRLDVARDFNLRILDLKFSTPINCDKAKEFRRNAFLQKYTETVYFRIAESTDDDYSSLSAIMSNRCTIRTYFIALIWTGIVFIVILSIIATAFFYRFWMKRRPNRQISMVIPDGKTYCETQIMIQIENAGLLKTNL